MATGFSLPSLVGWGPAPIIWGCPSPPGSPETRAPKASPLPGLDPQQATSILGEEHRKAEEDP